MPDLKSIEDEVRSLGKEMVGVQSEVAHIKETTTRIEDLIKGYMDDNRKFMRKTSDRILKNEIDIDNQKKISNEIQITVVKTEKRLTKIEALINKGFGAYAALSVAGGGIGYVLIKWITGLSAGAKALW